MGMVCLYYNLIESRGQRKENRFLRTGCIVRRARFVPYYILGAGHAKRIGTLVGVSFTKYASGIFCEARQIHAEGAHLSHPLPRTPRQIFFQKMRQSRYKTTHAGQSRRFTNQMLPASSRPPCPNFHPPPCISPTLLLYCPCQHEPDLNEWRSHHNRSGQAHLLSLKLCISNDGCGNNSEKAKRRTVPRLNAIRIPLSGRMPLLRSFG